MSSKCSICKNIIERDLDFCPSCYTYLGSPRPFRIKSRDFQSAGDRDALEDIKDIPGVDLIVSKAVDLLQLPWVKIRLLGTCVKVDYKDPLWVLTQNAARQLCLDKMPEIFLCSKGFNASTLGTEKRPLILVSRKLLKMVSISELEAILAHEVAHIKARHVEYTTLLKIFFEGFQFALGGSLITNLLSDLLIKKWQRAAEYSADRGSLIVGGDLSIVTSMLLRLHGLKGSIDINEYSKKISDSTLEEIDQALKSHPHVVKRIEELQLFYKSKQYENVRSKVIKNNSFYHLFRRDKNIN